MYTRENLKSIREDVVEALKAVGEKYNTDFNLGNISFSQNEFSAKLEAKVKLKDGEDPYKADFDRYCVFYGLKPSDFRAKLEFGRYELVGFNHNSPKYALKILDLKNGKEYKGSMEMLKSYKSEENV